MEEAEGQQRKRPRLYGLEGTKRKGQEELHFDLRNMVNNPESSDVILRCSDGIGVHASRLLLANRCAVFKSMLSNGMLESTLSEIQLVEFSSPIMLAIVEYLYTGTIESYRPANWKMGLQIMSAAQFFIIPGVKTVAHDFLRNKTYEASCYSQPSRLMDMLSIAIEVQETWEGKDAMLLDLIDYIGPDWFEEDFSHNLSRSAVEYILSNYSYRGDGRGGEDEPSLEEYFMLRKAILWHVYQVVPISDTEARTAVQNVLPEDIPLTLWRKMSHSDIDDIGASTFMDLRDSTPVLNTLVGKNICNDSLQQLLRHINFSQIPVPLLLNVIHPLRIIPPQQLLKALVHVALLHRPVRCSVAKSDWKHGPSLRIGNEGQIMCGNKIDKTEGGMAIAFVPMPQSSHIYEWSFEVFEDDAKLIEVGFFCQAAGHVFEDYEMLTGTLREKPSTRVLSSNQKHGVITVSRGEPEWNPATWDDFAATELRMQADGVVNLKLSVLEKTCQVMLGNTKQAVWKDLPDGDYYPAVGFRKCTNAKVQLRLISGFEYF